MATIHTVTELMEEADPRAVAIADYIADEMELTIAKVAAHYADPGKFPLPVEENALEHVIKQRADTLLDVNRQAAVGRFKRLEANRAAVQPMVGGQPAVVFTSPTPMLDQVQRLPLPAALTALMAAPTMPVAANPVLAAATAPPLNKLEFRIHSVKCVDETGITYPWPIGNPGSDEISLGGTSVDETGDTKKVGEFKVGNFDGGDVKNFSPAKRFTWFNLTEGTTFPKTYFVTLVLAEKDQGGLNGFLNALQEKVEAAVRAYFKTHGPIGIAVGEVVVLVVAKLFNKIRSWFLDDIFSPVTLRARIASLNHRFASGNTHSRDATATFKGHNGLYQVAYDWRVFA